MLIFLATLASLAGLHAAEEYKLYAWLTLERATGQESEWTVTRIEGDTSHSPSPAADFEAIPKRLEIKQGISRLVPPFSLAELPVKLSALDARRTWLTPENFSPQPGRQRVLLRYGNPSAGFTVDVHVFDNDSAPTSAPLPLAGGPGLFVTHHAANVEGDADFARAVTTAAERALALASERGLVPGGPPGDHHAIREALQAEFQLLSTDNPDYRPNAPGGQKAIGLLVQPVAIPRHIAVELTNWMALEKDWDAASLAALRKKRLKTQDELRDTLVPAPRDRYTLVTNPVLQQWKEAPQARQFELTEDRYEGDTLILRAVKPTSRQDYVLSTGVEYDATHGLLGSVSAGVVHERVMHLDLNTEINHGEDASNANGFLRWHPLKTWSGWMPKLEASAESRSNDRAYFGRTLPEDTVPWRHRQARAGFTMTRDMSPPRISNARIRASYSFSAQLAHTDAEFQTSAPIAEAPDTRFEIRAATQVAIPFRENPRAITVTAHVRLARSLKNLGGHYDGHLGEGLVAISYVIPTGTMTWKTIASLRGGRIEGSAPLAGEFRAGGDDGWIRGLREGELTGRAYWAQSLAAGPLVPFLSGKKDSGRPPVYLLAFVDAGRVRESSGAWHSAGGYGLTLNLDDLPLGGGKTAALYLGYAYSPASTADRSGSIFVRLDIPLEL